MKYMLGKHMPRSDRRTLMLANYVNLAALPPIPASKSWDKGIVDWTEMGNDEVGCCTEATAGHMIMGWTANAKGQPCILTTQQVLAAYSRVTGYDPFAKLDEGGSNPTDTGANCLDVLNDWRQNGVGGHNILAYAKVNQKLTKLVTAGAYLFGGLYLGLALPAFIQTLDLMDKDWKLPINMPTDGSEEPYSLGGHAVPVINYDAEWVSIVTWGGIKRVSWPFFKMYCDEAYVAISEDWLTQSGITPSGVNLQALRSDLKLVTAA